MYAVIQFDWMGDICYCRFCAHECARMMELFGADPRLRPVLYMRRYRSYFDEAVWSANGLKEAAGSVWGIGNILLLFVCLSGRVFLFRSAL